MARGASRRSQGQGDRRILQDARRVTPLPVGGFPHRPYSGRGVFRCRHAIADPNDPRPHMYPDAAQFVRKAKSQPSAFLPTIPSSLTIPAAWVAAPSRVVDVPVVRSSQGEGAGWRVYEVDATKAARPTVGGKVFAETPGKFSGEARSRRHSQPGSNCVANIKTKVRAVGRCASAADVLKAASPEPWPGRTAPVTYPGEPQRALFESCSIAKTGAMKSLEELRQAFTRALASIPAKADRDDLWLRRLGAGVDAGAVSPRRARHARLYDGSWAEWGLPDGPRACHRASLKNFS